MTNGMRKQYQIINRRDFRTVVESYCPVQFIKYHHGQDKFYGEYVYQEEKIHIVQLNDDFFQANQNLIKFKTNAKKKPRCEHLCRIH